MRASSENENSASANLTGGVMMVLEVVVIKVVIIVAPQWEVMGRFQANT